ncbi:hypothetical protein D1164_00440 [Mariniphaga sediminis]|uniref:DUF1080 domain-containing protein n=2 Tax=Mariniphaga sediminis TaxID=1628158 RepID=A0A399D4U7_9BACT|nr:hypothetical protein D1164_00440 [Mariniphaga sediminis]
MLGLLVVLFCRCQYETNRKGENMSKTSNMNVIKLMKKQILLDSSPVLYDKKVTPEEFAKNWTVHHSEWKVEGDWLVGENRGNWPGMAIPKQDFPGNVLVEFEAQTILPSSHDINVMWNGEWLAETDQRGIAYVAGLQGWWTGKVGIEKSNDYKFMVGTPLFDFVPGKVYKIQAGSIDGHCFILANGRLLLEAMDPEPIDTEKYTKVGFEAYCSKIKIRNIIIRQIHWEPVEMKYEPEF